MPLHPRDVVVALKLVALDGKTATFAELATMLNLSPSQVHSSVKRLDAARLADGRTRKVRRQELSEFLVHGVRYAFYPELTGLARGVPTADGAPPLSKVMRGGEAVYVWPHPSGETRGQGLLPLDASVPDAARSDEAYYELLALVDALRVGLPRERSLARDMLRERLLKPLEASRTSGG